MIKAIAFDLDDTLLDTSNLLAPKATLDAFTLLIKSGLKLNFADCEKIRLEWIKSMSHREVIEKLALQYGDSQTQKVVKEAIDLFYEPHLPTSLPLLPGARENIDYLKKKYRLYLVTAGTESAQIKKARALGIEKDFLEIFVVNSLLKKRKKAAFLQIIEKNNLKAEELLCIGNSLSSEIFDAIQINAQSCYFEFGEDRGVLSNDPQLQPHFHIRNHAELIKTCQL